MNAQFVLEALLKHNYLPLQKKDKAEAPPFLTSVAFTPAVATKLAAATTRKLTDGWDCVSYQATRFNGVGRILTIPHPFPYALLCKCIHDNWANLSYLTLSKQSMVRPHQHPDGRIIIMDYEKSNKITPTLAFGKRFQVRTDITNFFPSIYSHAIAWATVGFQHAKKHKNSKAKWFNDLDHKVRLTKRNETQGVAIGPATSNIVAEAILTRIDAELVTKGFDFVRYIDDYTSFCESEDRAQEFILELSQALAKYKLVLNIKKTHIEPLPTPAADEWVAELALALKGGEIDAYTAAHYLSKAQAMASQVPDGSVLKYALKVLLSKKLKPGVERTILPEVLNLAYHQPALIPLLSTLLQKTAGISVVFAGKTFNGFNYGEQLHQLASVNARFGRSDGLCWALFFLNRHGVAISDQLAAEVIGTQDCLPLMLLYISGIKKHQDAVVDFAKQHISSAADLYELDQYWLLFYELFRLNEIADPYSGTENCFEILKGEQLSFLASAPWNQIPQVQAAAAAQAAGFGTP